jgi:hypothetical protein
MTVMFLACQQCKRETDILAKRPGQNCAQLCLACWETGFR